MYKFKIIDANDTLNHQLEFSEDRTSFDLVKGGVGSVLDEPMSITDSTILEIKNGDLNISKGKLYPSVSKTPIRFRLKINMNRSIDERVRIQIKQNEITGALSFIGVDDFRVDRAIVFDLGANRKISIQHVKKYSTFYLEITY